MTAAPPRAEMLFEVSWEVCNKVGGIHTVIQSKLTEIQKRYSKYVLIGPLTGNTAQFQPQNPPPEWREIFDELSHQGIRVSYGTWRAPNEPVVILVDGSSLDLNWHKKRMWDAYGVDSINAGHEFNEPLLFSIAAGVLVEAYARRHDERIVLQCHEWMAGFALLHTKLAAVNVATIFTTHATILGRTIMGNGYPLYELLPEMNPTEWAQKMSVQDKHTSEVACAREADVFTTVSEITAMEAKYILGRKADVILYNGFSTTKFATFEETSIRHNQSRDALRELAAYAFFPHYAFDLEKTLFFFTSGRYEFQNKGIDVFIDALGTLNERLKGSDQTIVVFFWVIMGRHAVNIDLLEKKNAYYQIKSYVEWQSKPLLQKIILDFLAGHSPGRNDAFTTDFIKQLHRDIHPFSRDGDGPMCTHEIDNPHADPILTRCRANGLTNKKENNVKVLLYPGYLDGSDGLLHLDYYDTTVGAHLGIFPSHYEPWGYTPLESAVLGVPAITTDLAGFGRYVQDKAQSGIFVIPRKGVPQETFVNALTEKLSWFVNLTHEERVREGFGAKTIATGCDWSCFVQHYVDAHNLALEKRGA